MRLQENYKKILAVILAAILLFAGGYVCGLRYSAGGDGAGTKELLDRAADEGRNSQKLNYAIKSENSRGAAAVDRASEEVAGAQESADEIATGIDDSQGKLSEAVELNRRAVEELDGAEQILRGILGSAEKGKSTGPAEGN